MSKLMLSITLVFITSAFVILACGKSGDDGYGNNNNNNNNNGSGANNISIYNMSFGTGSLTVKAGTTVKWTNNDNMTHTVTADDSSFDSGNIAAGGTYSHTFSTAGTYKYHCTLHSGMTGTVTVNSY